MFSTRSLCSPSTSLVREALQTNGPQTTRALYSLLQDRANAQNESLPARTRPRGFLQGYRRRQLQLNSGTTASGEREREDSDKDRDRDRLAPGEGTGENGWSMRYLKTKVLGGMHARGEVLKLTRARWERAQARDQQAVVESEITTTKTTGSETSAESATAVKELHRHEEEHVWVTRDMWTPLKDSDRARKTEGGPALREDELRASYGLASETTTV